MKKNNLLQTIDSWGPFFKVTFDLMVHSKPTSHWSGLLAFKGNGGSSNLGKYGDRAPAIFYNKNGYLRFSDALDGNITYVITLLSKVRPINYILKLFCIFFCGHPVTTKNFWGIISFF